MNPLVDFSLHHHNLEAGLTLVLNCAVKCGEVGKWGLMTVELAASENCIREDFIF